MFDVERTIMAVVRANDRPYFIDERPRGGIKTLEWGTLELDESGDHAGSAAFFFQRVLSRRNQNTSVNRDGLIRFPHAGTVSESAVSNAIDNFLPVFGFALL